MIIEQPSNYDDFVKLYNFLTTIYSKLAVKYDDNSFTNVIASKLTEANFRKQTWWIYCYVYGVSILPLEKHRYHLCKDRMNFIPRTILKNHILISAFNLIEDNITNYYPDLLHSIIENGYSLEPEEVVTSLKADDIISLTELLVNDPAYSGRIPYYGVSGDTYVLIKHHKKKNTYYLSSTLTTFIPELIKNHV